MPRRARIPHGAGVATGVPFVQRKKPKPPKRPPKGKPNRPPGFLFDDINAQAEAEADRIINELLAELGLSRDAARREAERSAQQEMERARAYSEALTRLGIPAQIQDIYGRSAGSIGQLAQGFSSEVQGIANAQAAEQANMLSGTGQESAVRNAGVGMGDVLYGTEGYIPARSLEQMGSAFASQAALQPGFALQFGQMNASKVMQDFTDEVLPEFTDKETEIRMKRSGLVADAKDRRKQEVLERYKMGFATQREVARALGVKDWRKYPNVPLTEETERPKASASLSKAVGYLVDEYGAPILNRKGKVIPLPKDPAKLERFGNAQSGYWVMDPTTGEIQNIIPPVAPTQRQTTPKGYQLKTLEDGSTAVFDPNTGQVTVIAPPPKGSGKKSGGLTPTQRRKAVATAKRFARDMLFGFEENGERVSPNMNLGEALQAMSEMIAQGEIDVPWNLARKVIIDFYSRYVKGPPAPKGKPPKGGTRDNASFSPQAATIVNAAMTQLGKPYVFGSGPSTASFDCSDLVQWAYAQIGIKIPRVTWDQIKVGRPVKWGQFQPGDLVFTNKGGHVMLYIGNGKMISAPYTGSVVKVVDVAGYKGSFYAARRILPDIGSQV